MFGSIKDQLTQELADIEAAGLYKRERVITSAQDAEITLDDKSRVLNFCANNYLGLSSHPRVVEVAVIGQPSKKWGESPFAVIVKNDDTLLEEDILSFCDEKLARFKLPKGVAFIDVIPRNANGKVLKRLLREQFPGPAAN